MNDDCDLNYLYTFPVSKDRNLLWSYKVFKNAEILKCKAFLKLIRLKGKLNETSSI